MDRDNMELAKRLEQKRRNPAGGIVALCGVAVALSPTGLWTHPGALSGADVITIRIGLTCFMIAFGFLLVRMGLHGGDEFAIDYDAGKLFQLRRSFDGATRLRCSFDLSDLDALGFEDDMLVARTRDGEEIMRVVIKGPVSKSVIERIATGYSPAVAI